MPVDLCCKSDWQASACISRAGISIKLFVWAGITIKTFGAKKLKSLIVKCPRFYLPTLERYDMV